jgi:hypothetical protein
MVYRQRISAPKPDNEKPDSHFLPHNHENQLNHHKIKIQIICIIAIIIIVAVSIVPS